MWLWLALILPRPVSNLPDRSIDICNLRMCSLHFCQGIRRRCPHRRLPSARPARGYGVCHCRWPLLATTTTLFIDLRPAVEQRGGLDADQIRVDAGEQNRCRYTTYYNTSHRYKIVIVLPLPSKLNLYKFFKDSNKTNLLFQILVYFSTNLKKVDLG